MAEVYRAVHPSLHITVAIKLLSPPLAEEPGFQHRFLREAKVASRLHHPNIVRVFDYGQMDGTFYMIMEYLAGQDLGKKLAQEGRLPLAEALPVLSQIASALDYAHTQGLVHRDIKPSNIMIEDCDNGKVRAVLTDFGIAKILTGHTALTGTGMLGTLDYISPEQIQAQADLGPSADIYSLGIMAYRMLCGVLPFQQQNPGALLIAHLTQPPASPRAYAPDLPASAAAAILRALEKSPANRFPSAGDFVRALGA
jgi:eukaryotic-like serine/threonine-protein kinase